MNASLPTSQRMPAADWADGPLQRSALREAIAENTRISEREAIEKLCESMQADPEGHAATQALAGTLVEGLRAHRHGSAKANLIQDLLQTYTLSSREGVALMCLAESLLRIPDAAMRDAMIRDKVTQGHWSAHLGETPSVFVNAATWGLLITGQLLSPEQAAREQLGESLKRVLRAGAEPLIRHAMGLAMQIMGHQFVAGETIAKATQHAAKQEAKGYRYSYDMLGEAAMTATDAARYLKAYTDAITHIGLTATGSDVINRAGISIKLSALHPRYSRAQKARVMAELYPKLLELVLQAKTFNIGLNIDAEEADRLDLSLDLLERLCFEPALKGFDGIGFVLQAYQKRCPYVIDWLIDLAQRSEHRLMVRLVKGAYWDSEIKRAQVDGHADYPVYTQKSHTDVSYLVCAEKLLQAGDAIYPQFATHNAHTVAAIVHMANPAHYKAGQYEFQCLHGMGEALYDQIVTGQAGHTEPRPCRIYAPVGAHETLLAYLVRRLLENGANTSFINRVSDKSIPMTSLIEDPRVTTLAMRRVSPPVDMRHPQIPLPADIYGVGRRNATGVDLSDEKTLEAIGSAIQTCTENRIRAHTMTPNKPAAERVWRVVRNPADHQQTIGYVALANPCDIDHAFKIALSDGQAWSKTAADARACALDKAADLMLAQTEALMALLMHEAGKTAANAIAEVREAVDFLRYYAAQVRSDFSNDTHHPLGPVVCISPWNFPLAIFIGQISAALAAGNTVVAKPAEQTPLIAAKAVALLMEGGVPSSALHLLHGDGATIGAAMVSHTAVAGVVFTGSTEVARLLQKTLSTRLGTNGQPIPLIAETGGQNAMIVDSSALTEQAVADIVSSAFDSAGQRCSALRLLCLQTDVADTTLAMLRGAMAELSVGNPAVLSTDVGPVIDEEAKAAINHHIATLRAAGCKVTQSGVGEQAEAGTFVAPTLIEINAVSDLTHEIFGPVCHVIRYAHDQLSALIDQINALGFGLTMGLHTRSDATMALVRRKAAVGNLYINRNQVGAVVGVQPFGGEGESGTGPKAGGPLYLLRLLSDRRQATQGPSEALSINEAITLPGPTGEHNQYQCVARARVLCLADDFDDRMSQTHAIWAVGGKAVWPTTRRNEAQSLSPAQRDAIVWCDDWEASDAAFDFVLLHGNDTQTLHAQQVLAQRPGPIIGLWRGQTKDAHIPLERLVIERSVSNNTTASGGNVGLMRLETLG